MHVAEYIHSLSRHFDNDSVFGFFQMSGGHSESLLTAICDLHNDSAEVLRRMPQPYLFFRAWVGTSFIPRILGSCETASRNRTRGAWFAKPVSYGDRPNVGFYLFILKQLMYIYL